MIGWLASRPCMHARGLMPPEELNARPQHAVFKHRAPCHLLDLLESSVALRVKRGDAQ